VIENEISFHRFRPFILPLPFLLLLYLITRSARANKLGGIVRPVGLVI